MDNTPIRALVNKRKKEIFNQIKELRNELREIKAVEQTLLNQGASDSQSDSRRKGAAITFQDMIVTVLENIPQGADANQILELIDKEFGKKIKRSSVSPQLSRLKANGVLTLKDNIWSLINQTQKNAAPEGAAGDEADDLV